MCLVNSLPMSRVAQIDFAGAKPLRATLGSALLTTGFRQPVTPQSHSPSSLVLAPHLCLHAKCRQVQAGQALRLRSGQAFYDIVKPRLA